MAYDAKKRYETYRANKKKQEESDERSIQNKMRYNQTHDQQNKVDAASDRNVQNQMRRNQNNSQQNKIDESNERKIRNQMRYDSNHDRQLISDDKDEANIRNSMRQRSALDKNKYYKEGVAARKAVNKAVRKTGEAIDAAAKSISKKGPGYQQQNPTASGGGYRGGQMDREWKNHKWVSRERSDSGKWMYEYGGGTSGGAKPAVKNKSGREVTKGKKPAAKYQERNDFEKAMTKAHDAVRNTGANLNRALRDLGDAASDAVQNGSKFLNDLFK